MCIDDDQYFIKKVVFTVTPEEN